MGNNHIHNQLKMNHHCTHNMSKGNISVIADALSRDMHICDNKLIFLINNLLPCQTQKNLYLNPLSKETLFWLYSLKGMLTNRLANHVEQTPSSLGHLISGNDSWPVVVSRMNSWRTLYKNNVPSSCRHLQQVLDAMDMEEQGKHNYAKELSIPPLVMLVRPSRQTYGMTHL